MKLILKSFSLLAAFILFTSSALAAFENDLSISGDELVLQPASGVVAGQSVKIYTTVRNNGEGDLIGTVKFFVDGAQVATDQPISVKQGSIPDEVFVNWVAQAGNHKVSAQIYPYELAGDDPGNNYVEKDFLVDADFDKDGVGNATDIDDDNDGLEDANEGEIGTNPLDPDSDNDGVNDGEDEFPMNPLERVDTDSDGIGDDADDDDDDDGLPDKAEENIGTDPLNPDSDGDGIEHCNDLRDAFPLDATECADRDGDGVGDNADAFADDPQESADCDSDGIGDNADSDDDNDGVKDADDALQCNANEWEDCDGDGVGDNEDADDDNDEHADDSDAFPCNPEEWEDSDQDGLGNNADPDDANQGPVPIFSGDRIVSVNEEVNFDASQSSDVDGKVVAFAWNFGDGATADGVQTVHVYEKVGEYVMKLTIADDKGESRMKEAIIVVENSPWLEQALLWLMIALLLLFLYIFWKTVQHKQRRIQE